MFAHKPFNEKNVKEKKQEKNNSKRKSCHELFRGAYNLRLIIPSELQCNNNIKLT